MQTAGKPRNNKEHEEVTKLFQRGEKILGGCWILIMALSALLLLAGVYFAVTGRGEWIETAAVLVPFLITGALVLFMASPYKKGVRELQKKEKFSPSTQRIISSFSGTNTGRFVVLAVILFFTAVVLALMGALFLWLGRAEGDLLVFAAGAFLVSLAFPSAASGILDVAHVASRR